MQQAKNALDNEIAWVLVQNKVDVLVKEPEKAEVTKEEVQALATRLGTKFYLVSVGRPGSEDPPMNVDNVFTYLAEAAYELMKQPKNVPSHGTEMDSQRVCDAEATMSECPGSNVALTKATVQLGGPTKQRTGGKKACC